MRKKTIDLAQAFVGALQRHTNDQSTMWRELHPIAKAAGLERDEMAAAAVATVLDAIVERYRKLEGPEGIVLAGAFWIVSARA